MFLCFFLVSLTSQATHIVGGDLNYEYLSQNRYRVTLYLYIDCVNGSPGAISSDNLVYFNYFNAKDSTLINFDEIEKSEVKRVEEIHYKCLKNEPNACVQRFTYSYIKEIDPGNDGVILAFQRCCRNRTISNIVQPENTGATFFTTIPGRKNVAVNSSPVFKKLPPNFLCTSAPLVFDHSAIDKEGDSLVYDLITPYAGATADFPRPGPSSRPPFANILMKSPFNKDNFMHGSVKLNINSKSGELRVTPSVVGQFVVGMRVREYRNGRLIGSTYRDYQFNVIDCQFDVIANFEAPDRLCARTVDFLNLSLGDGIDYAWDFGEVLRSDDVSVEKNPHWSYNSEGNFMVRLIVKNTECVDTFSKSIIIVSKDSIFARFSIAPKFGCDSLLVKIDNKSDLAFKSQWDMGDGKKIAKNVSLSEYTYHTPGKYKIKLTLEDSNKCNITHSMEDEVEVLATRLNKVSFNAKYKENCLSDGKVKLNSSIESPNYFWDFGEGTRVENQNVSNFKYDKEGVYDIWLKTRDTGRCVQNDSFKVQVTIADPTPLISGVELYNVFTPNNDAYNHCFSIDVAKAACVDYRFKVYNRWGEKVFETTDLESCWNGSHYITRKDLPAGEYFGIYFFSLKGSEEELILENVITIIR